MASAPHPHGNIAAVESAPPVGDGLPRAPRAVTRYAVIGNPNTGKTTLVNRLCGMRLKTANFPGSTVDARIGRCATATGTLEIIDLPGVYGLHLDIPESRIARDCLEGKLGGAFTPEALLVIADATNLTRNLSFIAQTLCLGLPTVVAINMIDLAQRKGLSIDAEAMSRRLGCPVVTISARTGANVEALRGALASPSVPAPPFDAPLPSLDDSQAVVQWADDVMEQSVGGTRAVGGASDTLTDRLDAAFTHPVLGLAVFFAAMAGLFYVIFALAAVPMDMIERLIGSLGGLVHSALPDGAIRDLLVEGVVGGIAGTVVFLPQICLLFFLISLLEDTGYLARAAFVMDRLMRRFGLPGQAFVPLLSAHACAIPAIMSTRLIPDHRDRLATALVIPFMSCSARLPVYVLMITFLFPERPFIAGLVFAGCYALGAIAALLTAALFRATFLKGVSRPMLLELPGYKWPSLRTALLTTFDRGVVFLRKAGTVIVGICIVLWWLSAFPHVEPPPEAVALEAQAVAAETAGDIEGATALHAEAESLAAKHQHTHSFMGRLGRGVEPVMRPLGYDWQLSIGILSSFAAREVFVSTMVVVLEGDEEEEPTDDLVTRLSQAERSDGTLLFTAGTSASLLVFYVLAMQCLPTLAVTRRETGSWNWALLQLGWMTAVAYIAALITKVSLAAFGVS
jgi:ferrous iron transport protein B